MTSSQRNLLRDSTTSLTASFQILASPETPCHLSSAQVMRGQPEVTGHHQHKKLRHIIGFHFHWLEQIEIAVLVGRDLPLPRRRLLTKI